MNAYYYDVDSNNYKDSDIRTWLNNDFYNTAFTLGNEYIQTTTVDNSSLTTHYASNPYACENTQDKVFLSSYKDYTNSAYGFGVKPIDDDKAKECKPTDYARVNGVFCYHGSAYLYKWLLLNSFPI